VAGLLANTIRIAETKGLAPVDCNGRSTQLAEEPDLREAFTRAVVRAHQHHIDDLKEIRFVPNFLHTLAVVLGRLVLALGRKIRG
jgi:hypothetical protein